MAQQRQINYNIGFTADKTSLANIRAELQNLKIMTASDYLKIKPELDIIEAMRELDDLKTSIKDIEVAFAKSFNANLGTTNITTLKKELSSLNLNQIASQFSSLGAQGVRAWQSVTSSVLGTNLQLEKTQTVLDKMATTMGNTIKWGIASSAMNTFTGNVQKAYSYVQKLDKSLNDIRIVSDQSAKDMASFAVQANKAAAALGATTLDYTNASLIFYQQGLTGEDVTERADAVVKMTNVTGDAADKVSSYMTAVWNNFADGSKELEYYADVMTALGAATASSTQEIADGLEKFASIADTVGLSYEYATSALATVVAETRQSADTVGTAFKTLFARIQGLNLGETLDDGTTLNKYSEALAKVGISIKQQNGELKDMDDILNELGAKWETLGKDQQVALAQTVAGVRQYNQLIALMDNWDKMQENLKTASNSAGTLQKQQDTYMESLEGHLNRLTSAEEHLYDVFFDSDSFKQLVDVFTDLVNGIGEFVDAIGGGGNALLLMGTIATKVFDKQIAQGITNLIKNSKIAETNLKHLQAQQDILDKENQAAQQSGNKSLIAGTQVASTKHGKMMQYKSILSQEDIEKGNNLIKIYSEATSKTKELEIAQEEAAKAIKEVLMLSDEEKYKNYSDEDFKQEVETQALDETGGSDFLSAINKAKDDLTDIRENISGNEKDFQPKIDLETLEKIPILGKKIKKEFADVISKYNEDFELMPEELSKVLDKAYKEIDDKHKAAVKGAKEATDANIEVAKAQEEAAKNDVDTFFDEKKLTQNIQNIADLTSGVSSLGLAISSAANIGSIWSNDDLSTGEKLIQTIMAMTTAIGLLANAVQSLKNADLKGQWKNITEAVGKKIQGSAAKEVASVGAEAVASKALASGTKQMAEMGAAAAETGVAVEGVSAAAGEAGAATASAGAVGAAAIIGIAAAAAVVALAIWGIVKAYNADADAAKKAKEEAIQTKEQYDDIKESYKQLTNEITNYADSIEAIKKLKEGTQEWKEAVLELNEQVLTLIDKYPELAAAVSATDNGILTIAPEAINRLLENQFNKVQGGYRASNAATIKADKAELKSAKTDYRRGISYTQEIENPNYNNPYNDTSDFNTYERPTQTVSKSMTEDEVNTLSKALENNGLAILENREALQKATGFNNELADAILEDKDSAIKLNGTLVETNASIKALNLANAQSYLSTHSTGFTNLSGEDQQKIAQAFTTESETERKAVDKSGDYDAGWFGWSWLFGGKSDKTIHQEYAELMGYNTDNIKDKTGAAVFKDSNDKDVKVSDDVMREALAQEQALKQANASTQEYINALNKMTTAGNKAADDFGLTGTEAKNTSTLLKTGFQGDFDFSTATDDQLSALQNVRNDESQWANITKGWKEAGYKSADDFTKAFDEQMETWNTSEKSAERARNLQEATNLQFAAAIREDAEALGTTENALLSYTEHLMDTNEELKDDKLLAEQIAVSCFEFADGLEALGEALDSNEQLLDDWKNGLTDSTEAYEAVGKVQDALQQMFGVRVSEDYVSENLERLKDLANGDVSALEELKEKAAEDYVAHVEINADTTRAQQIRDELNGYIDEFANKNIEIGASIDDQDFINALNNMIDSGEMTADQVQTYLDSIGYEPEWEEESSTTEPQTMHATTDVSANVFGKDIKVATLSTDTTIDGVTATMFGIQNAKGDNKKKLTGARKVSNTNYQKGAVKNSGKSGKKVGDSGGGNKDPKTIERLEDEADRYHQIDTQIGKVEKSLSKLQSQTDKYFGSKKIDNLNKQWELLNTQIKNYNEKLIIAQQEEDELRNKLSRQGVSFNVDGTIGNYMAAFKAQENYVNSLIDQYNRLSAEQQEVWDKNKTIDNAKENFNKFKENMDRYDELISDFIPELQQNIQDAIDEQIDLRIQEFNMEIEIRLNMAEAERDWNEFKKRVIDGIDEDDILGNARARLLDFSSYYNADGTGQVQALTKQVNGLLDQLYQQDGTDWATAYGDNRAQALEDLKDYYDQLKDSLMDILDLQEEIHDAYIDMIDEAADKFGDQVEMYETVRDLIEHDMNVIELVYGEEAYGALSKYYERQEENYNKQLDFQRQQKDFWYAQMQMMEEGSEEWEAAKENWLDAVDEWNSAVEDAIENLQDKYLNAINEIFQKLNNEVTAGKGLDYTNQEWELINKNAEQYLDTVDAAWGIQKLENKYMDAYDATDSIQARRQIKEIMDEELANLREQDKLTEYDIERANMRYDIMLKQIALQEAQQNKSKTRLRRDSQGNYRYEFVADDDEIGNLQDELGDLYNSLYDFDKEKYQDNLNQLYEIWVEFQEAMTEAAQINDPVARAERELLIRQQYEPLLNGILQENLDIRANLEQSAFDDLAYLYAEDAENFRAMTEEEKDAFLADLIPAWTSGIQQMADTMTGEGGFLPTVRDSLDEIDGATREYEDSLVDLQNSADQSFTDIHDNIDNTITQTQDLIWTNEDLINSYRGQLDAIREVIGELTSLINQYKAAESAAKAATDAAYKYWQEQQRQAAAAASKNSASVNGGGGGSSGSGSGAGGNSGGSGGGSGRGDGRLSVGDTATYTGKYYYDSYGTAPAGSKYSGVANGIVVDILNNNPYGVHIHSADGKYRDLGWIKRSQLSGYDTGGYTGEWGNTDGKLALLHQKELVLNSTDTQNILNAVNVMRGLSGAMLDRLSMVAANSNTGTFDGEFEQNVHIEANFPNVQNSHEIEDAIDNLMNRASQRINKRG